MFQAFKKVDGEQKAAELDNLKRQYDLKTPDGRK